MKRIKIVNEKMLLKKKTSISWAPRACQHVEFTNQMGFFHWSSTRFVFCFYLNDPKYIAYIQIAME